MAEWREAPDLKDLAARIIAKRDDVGHVEIGEVLFLWELELRKKGSGGIVNAECRSLKDDPIGHFTPERFAIIFYAQNMDYMNDRQRAILMWHELKHIPETGDKLKPHSIQDFRSVVKEVGIDWHEDTEVPDILA